MIHLGGVTKYFRWELIFCHCQAITYIPVHVCGGWGIFECNYAWYNAYITDFLLLSPTSYWTCAVYSLNDYAIVVWTSNMINANVYQGLRKPHPSDLWIVCLSHFPVGWCRMDEEGNGLKLIWNCKPRFWDWKSGLVSALLLIALSLDRSKFSQ